MEQRTLAEALAERARAHPERPALIDDEARWSYAQLDAAVDGAAAGLASVGVGRGDRVGLLAANGAGFVIALYGAWRAGAVAVPLNTATTAEEARTILADAAVAAIVVDHALREALAGIDDALDQHAEILDSDPAAWQALAADAALAAADGAPLAPDAGPAESPAPDAGPAESPAPDAGSAEPPAPGAPAGLALLAYTAGTTGTPRGAMLTHDHLAANHRQLDATHQRLAEGDVVLGALPMFHIYGLNVGLAYPLACGAAVRCLARFAPEASLDAVAADRVTVMPGVPPMLAAWAGRGPGERDLSALRLAASGAAPLDPAVAERFAAAFGVPVWEGYGLTETA
ncbi:MAG: AMP-binding protein, partial [Egibacteraceae bacterium]